MQEQLSLFTTDTKNSMDGSEQIRWLINRCQKCNSRFTVTLLKDDIPIATTCMSCTNAHIYTNREKPNAY